MAKSTLSFVCQNCGAAYNRWQGKCDSCGEWNTLAEEDTTGSVPVSIRSKRKGRTFALESLSSKTQDAPRLSSGMTELDRVTGGGFVRGGLRALRTTRDPQPQRQVRQPLEAVRDDESQRPPGEGVAPFALDDADRHPDEVGVGTQPDEAHPSADAVLHDPGSVTVLVPVLAPAPHDLRGALRGDGHVHQLGHELRVVVDGRLQREVIGGDRSWCSHGTHGDTRIGALGRWPDE